MDLAQGIDERPAALGVPPARVPVIELFGNVSEAARQQGGGFLDRRNVSRQLGVGVDPREAVGPDGGVDLAAVYRLLHAHHEHARSRLRKPPAGIQLEGVDGIAEAVELLDDHAEIVALVRGREPADVLQDDSTRRALSHMLYHVHEPEEGSRLGPFDEPPALARKRKVGAGARGPCDLGVGNVFGNHVENVAECQVIGTPLGGVESSLHIVDVVGPDGLNPSGVHPGTGEPDAGKELECAEVSVLLGQKSPNVDTNLIK